MADSTKTPPTPDANAPENGADILQELQTQFEQLLSRIATLEEKDAKASAELETLKAQVSTLEETINALLDAKPAGKQAETETPGLKGTVFTIRKKKYKLQYPQFTWAGKTYTEESLLADTDVQEELVEAGSKMLLPV